MEYSGAGGKLIHEKTRSKKSRDTVPLKVYSGSKYLIEKIYYFDLKIIIFNSDFSIARYARYRESYGIPN
jgi:hypothetical protein